MVLKYCEFFGAQMAAANQKEVGHELLVAAAPGHAIGLAANKRPAHLADVFFLGGALLETIQASAKDPSKHAVTGA